MNQAVTTAQLARLRKAFSEIPDNPPSSDIHALLWTAQREGIESLIKDLELELASQESLAERIVRRWRQELLGEHWSLPNESQLQMMAQWAAEEIENETT